MNIVSNLMQLRILCWLLMMNPFDFFFSHLVFGRCGRIRKIDHCKTDENHPWNWLFTRRMRTISTSCLQQHNTKFNGNNTRHGTITNRFCWHQQNGKKNANKRTHALIYLYEVTNTQLAMPKTRTWRHTDMNEKIIIIIKLDQIILINTGNCTTIFYICVSSWRRCSNTWASFTDEDSVGRSWSTEMLCTVNTHI